jgi:hypothetical protein
MEVYLDKPTPRGRLVRSAYQSVTLGSPQSLINSLVEVNKLLTGQEAGDFATDDMSKQQLWRTLLTFVGQAYRGYGLCTVRLGDESSSLQILVMDRETSITVTPDSDLSVKDKWDALE